MLAIGGALIALATLALVWIVYSVRSVRNLEPAKILSEGEVLT
jgi:hypothetical protein